MANGAGSAASFQRGFMIGQQIKRARATAAEAEARRRRLLQEFEAGEEDLLFKRNTRRMLESKDFQMGFFNPKEATPAQRRRAASVMVRLGKFDAARSISEDVLTTEDLAARAAAMGIPFDDEELAGLVGRSFLESEAAEILDQRGRVLRDIDAAAPMVSGAALRRDIVLSLGGKLTPEIERVLAEIPDDAEFPRDRAKAMIEEIGLSTRAQLRATTKLQVHADLMEQKDEDQEDRKVRTSIEILRLGLRREEFEDRKRLVSARIAHLEAMSRRALAGEKLTNLDLMASWSGVYEALLGGEDPSDDDVAIATQLAALSFDMMDQGTIADIMNFQLNLHPQLRRELETEKGAPEKPETLEDQFDMVYRAAQQTQQIAGTDLDVRSTFNAFVTAMTRAFGWDDEKVMKNGREKMEQHILENKDDYSAWLENFKRGPSKKVMKPVFEELFRIEQPRSFKEEE